MAFVRSVKRHAWTLYWSAIAAVGSSVVVVATLLMPGVSSPVAGRLPGPVVTVTVGPTQASPKAGDGPTASSSPSAGVVGAHHEPTPRIVLVGLPPSPVTSPPGPTVLPTPSAAVSGSSSSSPSPSGSPSTSSRSAVSLGVRAVVTPKAAASIAAAVAVLGARVTATVTVP